MSNRRLLVTLMLLAALIGGVAATVTNRLFSSQPRYLSGGSNTGFLSFLKDSSITVPEGLNFVFAANVVRPSVVHIKVNFNGGLPSSNQDGEGSGDPMEEFFRRFHDGEGFEFGPSQGTGSGVIISSDGYIVTNNHVIDNAKKIDVVLDDKRAYEGTVIGTDPSTDLALLKIDETGLPALPIGNSDKLQLGEWVLAVGSPYELVNTVTAGIVSAKARNLGMLATQKQPGVESFIQTDAAVNPGNSGGALVNLKGELVGINSAIASTSGAFAGYSFAVPVAIVSKVVEDLKKYGEVKRGLLGVRIQDIDAKLAKDQDLGSVKGVYVVDAEEGTAAAAAGIKSGDVITKIDGIEVNSGSELIGLVARKHPGEKVSVTYLRKGKEMTVSATLKSASGETSIKSKPIKTIDVHKLGATVQSLTTQEKGEYGITGGVRIKSIKPGSKLADAEVPVGFIITRLDKQAVNTPEDLLRILRDIRAGGVLLEGINDQGERAFYAIGL